VSTVVITIDGINETADVVFSEAHFESQVNGVAGQCRLRIRDLDRTKTFTVGSPLLLQIDGDAVWRGYVSTVNRVYVFSAINVDDFGLARFIDLTGSDVNILFAKRVVFDQVTPTNMKAPLLAAHTADTTAITALLADWLDLTGDGLDTTTYVENVGDTTWTQEGRAWAGSNTWGQAMASIANMPSAIYYIDPDLNLVYTDVDTPNAPFALSDVTTGITVDRFDRTVAAGTTWGTGGLGTWVDDGTTDATVSVNGSKGIATIDTALDGQAIQQVPLTSAVRDHDTWSLSFRFAWPSPLGDFPFIESDFYNGVTFSGGDLYTYVEHSSATWPTTPTHFHLHASRSSSSYSDSVDIYLASTPMADEWATIRLEWDSIGQTWKGKYWLDSEVEPDWLAVISSVAITKANLGATPYLWMLVGTFDPASGSDWGFDDVAFTGVGPTPAGYREMEVLMDGSSLANDVMCWGIGYGTQTPVFVRDTDATSQATHGLWQLGQVTFGVYEQTTINRIAASIIDGSPQNKRGAKDDKVSVQCVTYEPGLRAAQKVDFTSTVFGFNDVIPIRKMEIDFENPTDPKYTLTLSHEIDTPFSFFDPFLTDFGPFPKCPPGMVKGPNGKCIFPPIIDPPECVCGITDTFTRTVAGGWGTSDSGLVWDSTYGALSVDGARGVNAVPGSASSAFITPGVAFSDVAISAQISSAGAGRTVYLLLDIYGGSSFVEVDFDSGGGLLLYDGNNLTGVSTSLAWGPATETRMRLVVTGNTVDAYVWQASGTQPSVPTLTLDGEVGFEYGQSYDIWVGAYGGTYTAYFDNFEISGVTRCTAVQLDDFNRTVTAGATPVLGPSTSGHSYTYFGGNSLGTVGIADGYLRITSGSSGAFKGFTLGDGYLLPAGPDGAIDRFRFSFRTSYVSAAQGDDTFEVLLSGGIGLEVDLDFSVSNGSVNVHGPGAVAPESGSMSMTWSLNSWYVFDAVLDENFDWRIKVYRVADGVPNDYDLSAEGGAPGGGGAEVSFSYAFWDNSSGHTFDLDYIEFDYVGKPCYIDCALVGWGWYTGSGDGLVGGTWLIDLSSLTLDVAADAGLADFVVFRQFNEAVYALLETGPFTISGRLYISYIPSGGNFYSYIVSFRDAFPRLVWAEFRVIPDSGGQGQLIFQIAGGILHQPGAAFAISVGWKDWSLGISATSVTLTVDGNSSTVTYPSFPTNRFPNPIDLSSVTELDVRLGEDGAFTDAGTYAISVDSVAGTSGSMLCSASVFEAPGVPSNTWVCEQFDVVTTTLTLAHSFLANSPVVYLNGIVQPQSSYTQDALAGTIEFDFTPAPTDVARVCYWSLP
jgi:hypothetical protein